MSLNGLTLQSQNDQQCILRASNGSLTVAADGLLTISFTAGANVGITGSYQPAYQGQSVNDLFLPDAKGGVGMYLIGSGSCAKPASWNAGWTATYRAASRSQLLLSVYPPRPFDQKQSLETMIHSWSSKCPYPSDQELTAWRKVGSILTLHCYIWQGTDHYPRRGERRLLVGPRRLVRPGMQKNYSVSLTRRTSWG